MKNVAKNVVLKIVLRAALSVRPKNNIFKNKEQASDQLASKLAFFTPATCIVYHLLTQKVIIAFAYCYNTDLLFYMWV